MKYSRPIMILLVLIAAPALGQMYEYTDNKGNTVITDSPPPGVESREKKMTEERLYRSTRSESDYPASENKGKAGRAARSEEKPKKRYDRVSAAMYMADW